MEHVSKEFIGKSVSLLTNEQRELLFFLYEELQIDSLSEEDQADFFESFMDGETLCTMSLCKSTLVEMIREIEDNLPEIESEEHVPYSNGRQYDEMHKLYGLKRNERKKQIIKKDNIIYVPFD